MPEDLVRAGGARAGRRRRPSRRPVRRQPPGDAGAAALARHRRPPGPRRRRAPRPSASSPARARTTAAPGRPRPHASRSRLAVRQHPVDGRARDVGRAARAVMAALAEADELRWAAPARPPAARCARRAPRRRRARARAARAAGRGRPRPGPGPRGTAAARPRRSGLSTRGPAARRACCPGRASSSSSPASSDPPSAGQSSTSERKSAGRARAASSSMQPPMLAPRAASHGAPDSGEQPFAGGDGVSPAVRPHLAAALAVAAEVERERGQPRRRRLLAHELVVLLAAAGAVAHEQGAARRRRPARKSRPASAMPSDAIVTVAGGPAAGDGSGRDGRAARAPEWGEDGGITTSLANGHPCDVLPSTLLTEVTCTK